MSHYHPNLPRIFFSKIGNQQLRTAIWEGVDKGEGKRTPLLFFNGIGANLEIAQTFADSFTGRDIITFDMPGIGGSPDPTFPYRPWWIASAAKKILIQNGYDSVDVLGVSWGGGPAQQFTWQYQDMVRHMVLCATTSGVTMVPGKASALVKMMSPRRYMDKEFLTKNFETLYGDATGAVNQFSINMIPPSVKGYLYQLGAMAGWSSLPFLRRIKVPSLILMGDQDHIVRPINGKMIHAILKHSHYHEFKGAGHLFMLTRREEFIHELRLFFNEPEVPLPEIEPVQLPSVTESYSHF